MQVMRQWRQKVTRTEIPAHPCIFCGGREEDTGHLRLQCARDEAVARLLCAKVEEFTADLPLADRAVEFMSWKEHGCGWTESLMTGVVPGDLKRLFATVRAASSRGPAKAKRFLEDMIQIGEDGYARRNHRLTQIGGKPCMHSCGVIPPYARRPGGSGSCRRGTHLMASPATYMRPFGERHYMRCWCPGRPSHTMRPCPHFPSRWRRRRRPMANGSRPGSPRTTPSSGRDPVRCPHSPGPWSAVPWYATRKVIANPRLQVCAGHPAVGNIMGWPREVLPVLQKPLCSLPVLVVATLLDVGVLWLYDRQLQRIIPVAEGQRSMADLVGSKQFARIQGDDALGHITEVLLSVPQSDDNVAADARHTLDALGLDPVVEARSGGQRMVIVSAQSPGPGGMDVVGEIAQDYGWQLLASGKQSLRVVRWPPLLEHLSGKLDPVSTWDQARQSLLRSATARALAGVLLQHHEACNDVWQHLWSQCCEGGCVPSQLVLPLKCSGCGETAPVWVHQCASIPLCGSC